MNGTETPTAGSGTPKVPVIDVSPLVTAAGDPHEPASRMGRACRENGFFYVVGHGVDEGLERRLEELSRRFFAQDAETKLRLRMALGGTAWRGYFPVGDELTSGKPDLKEGLYFGAELGADDPRVRAGIPLHGSNLFPAGLPGFREVVLEYLAAMTRLGHARRPAARFPSPMSRSSAPSRYAHGPEPRE